MSETEQRLYGCTLMMQPNLAEDTKQKELERIRAQISSGGSVIRIDDLKQVSLAYPIAKRRQAYRYYILFKATAACAAELGNNLRIYETVLRYLIAKEEGIERAIKRDPKDDQIKYLSEKVKT